MKTRPSRDHVIVKRIEEQRKSAGGIVITDSAPADDGKRVAVEMKGAEKMLFGKYPGRTVKVKGETLLVVQATDTAANAIGIMGGRSAFGKPVKTVLDLSDLIDEGLPVDVLEHVKEHSALTDAEMALALGVSTKTLARLRSGQGSRKTSKRPTLSSGQGDRLFRLARLVSFAEQVFENRPRAQRWLRQPQRGLGNRIPIDLMRTEVGAREVEGLLGRIEHGVYS